MWDEFVTVSLNKKQSNKTEKNYNSEDYANKDSIFFCEMKGKLLTRNKTKQSYGLYR
jgi:hypothetical protein